jgi:kdpB: K+-transporting ATPase, B subunit
LKSSVIGAFKKLSPRYMIKNPVMFVVEVGFFITLVMTFFPTIFGDDSGLRVYNGIVSAILFVTILFANFAESVAEGEGKSTGRLLKEKQKKIPLQIWY